jgi:hypothetical protein
VTGVRTDGEVLVIEVVWQRSRGRLRNLRADVFTLLGTIAESTTSIHQQVGADGVEYRVATGRVAEDTSFAPHGHTTLLRVGGPDVAALR